MSTVKNAKSLVDELLEKGYVALRLCEKVDSEISFEYWCPIKEHGTSKVGDDGCLLSKEVSLSSEEAFQLIERYLERTIIEIAIPKVMLA